MVLNWAVLIVCADIFVPLLYPEDTGLDVTIGVWVQAHEHARDFSVDQPDFMT